MCACVSACGHVCVCVRVRGGGGGGGGGIAHNDIQLGFCALLCMIVCVSEYSGTSLRRTLIGQTLALEELVFVTLLDKSLSIPWVYNTDKKNSGNCKQISSVPWCSFWKGLTVFRLLLLCCVDHRDHELQAGPAEITSASHSQCSISAC